MKEEEGNIFTFHGEVIQRQEKEALLKQRALSLWLTGLSGSGKTTVAKILERKLHNEGRLTMLLDGDNVRDGINANLGFSKSGRMENIRRVAEINKLFNACGVITINCFVSPSVEIRSMARGIIGEAMFHEIFIDTPIETCEERDVKGLYKKARSGEIDNFTGISAPYEAPSSPNFIVETKSLSPAQSAERLYDYIEPKIKID